LTAAGRFPEPWLVACNLACYCSQPGQWKDARNWVEKTFDLGDSKQVKLLALDDKDLEPLWTDIAEV